MATKNTKNMCIQLKRPDPSSVFFKVCWKLENKLVFYQHEHFSPVPPHYFTIFGGVTCQCHAIPASLDLYIGLRNPSIQHTRPKRPPHGLSFCTVTRRLQNIVISQQLRSQQAKSSTNPHMNKYFEKKTLSKVIVGFLLNNMTHRYVL